MKTNPLREIEKIAERAANRVTPLGSASFLGENRQTIMDAINEALILNTPAMGLMTLQQIEGILKVAYNKGVMAVECDREAAFRSDFPPPCPEVTPSPHPSAPESPALEALIDAYLRFVPTDHYKECGGLKLVLEARAEATRRTVPVDVRKCAEGECIHAHSYLFGGFYKEGTDVGMAKATLFNFCPNCGHKTRHLSGDGKTREGEGR